VAERVRARERPAHRRLTRLRRRHRVERRRADAAHAAHGGARQPPGHRVVGRLDEHRVPATVRHGDRGRRNAGDVHRLLVQRRERPPHPVGVGERKPEARRPHDRQQAVRAADLERHQRSDEGSAPALDDVAQHAALVAAPQPLGRNARRPDLPARHDERLVWQRVERDDRHRAVLAHRVDRRRERDRGIAAAARAQQRASASQRVELRHVEASEPHGRA
jgi:hypothetical protein